MTPSIRDERERVARCLADHSLDDRHRACTCGEWKWKPWTGLDEIIPRGRRPSEEHRAHQADAVLALLFDEQPCAECRDRRLATQVDGIALRAETIAALARAAERRCVCGGSGVVPSAALWRSDLEQVPNQEVWSSEDATLVPVFRLRADQGESADA